MLSKIDPKDLWALERFTMFTSSQNFRLLGNGAGGKGFDSKAMNYIEEKAIESMTDISEQPKLEFVESLLHGRMYEEPAYRHYVAKTNNKDMRYFGTENPVFIKHTKISGGSPDGLLGQGEAVYLGLELKCPSNSKNHFRNLKFRDQWDLKQALIHDYTQCQHLMMCTGAELWHWMSYDERFRDINLKGKIIEILPDKKFQDNLDIRIKMADKERKKIIEQISNQ